MADPDDTRELRQFITDLGRANERLAYSVRETMLRAAGNIQRRLREDAAGHPRFPQFGASITFEATALRDAFEVDIGPDKDRPQGALGNILYFGTSSLPPTLPDMSVALAAEEPALEAYLAQALSDSFPP